MTSPALKSLLEKQGYRFIGDHSAVKVCHYTKSALQGKIMCYKNKFYGIQSHRCVQATVAVNFCDFDCVFCWRERHNEPFTIIDDPKELVDKAVKAQIGLLQGFKGNSKADKERIKEMEQPIHMAISLNGENLYYPKISELIRELKKRKISSYVVTNGSLPAVIRKMELPTQLYISLDAPNEKLFLQIDKPMKPNAWKHVMESMDILKSIKGRTRTTIRITAIKNMNMVNIEEYGEIIKRADPDFLEIKGYSWIGTSRDRLQQLHVPQHHEVKEFSMKIAQAAGLQFIDEQEESRVVLLAKEDQPWRKMDFSNRDWIGVDKGKFGETIQVQDVKTEAPKLPQEPLKKSIPIMSDSGCNGCA